MSEYTLIVYVERDNQRVRELVDPALRLPFHWADEKAAQLNERYGPERTYKAVNANEWRPHE